MVANNKQKRKQKSNKSQLPQTYKHVRHFNSNITMPISISHIIEINTGNILYYKNADKRHTRRFTIVCIQVPTSWNIRRDKEEVFLYWRTLILLVQQIDLILLMILNQLNFRDFDFDLKSSQIWFYPTLPAISYKYIKWVSEFNVPLDT